MGTETTILTQSQHDSICDAAADSLSAEEMRAMRRSLRVARILDERNLDNGSVATLYTVPVGFGAGTYAGNFIVHADGKAVVFYPATYDNWCMIDMIELAVAKECSTCDGTAKAKETPMRESIKKLIAENERRIDEKSIPTHHSFVQGEACGVVNTLTQQIAALQAILDAHK